MSRVLVVDDEQRQRDHISRALLRDGYEVRTAASGREAIATGSEFRPDILIADWMLKDRLHGLQVSEALRALIPGLGTIVISGFPSADLRDDARSLQVSEFVEKPFEMARLRDAVRAAESSAPTPLDRSPIVVFQVDQEGAIRFPNDRARQLLNQAEAGESAGNLRDLIDIVDLSGIATATQQWVTVSPRQAPDQVWHLRAKEQAGDGGWLLVVIPDDQQQHKSHPVVQMLLDIEPAAQGAWPFAGRTLIVDDDQWVRHVVARRIEGEGGVCHTADSVETALRTCERDSGIDIVVLDHDLPGEDTYAFVRRLRVVLPEARIVGTSGTDHQAEFTRVGVEHFLLKPWAVTDLVNLLLERIGDCVSCGLPLPLRRPKPEEQPQRWVCAGCGGRYLAVLDKGFPVDVISNVRAAQPEQTKI